MESVSRRGGAGLGARVVPIVLTSRADNPRAHTVSCALALLLAHHKESTPCPSSSEVHEAAVRSEPLAAHD
jgi:hypothetical protein